MNLYDVMSGVVYISGGTYAFLAGTGRIDIKSSDPEKSKLWREKHGSYMTWAGPVIVLAGMLQLFGNEG